MNKWPDNVTLRFLNLGGATVDVLRSDADGNHRWTCNGCRDTSQPDAREIATASANLHAGTCRGMQNPSTQR